METVIKELTQTYKDLKHWEKLSLIRGENKRADYYGKLAKEYDTAIKILCEGKDTSDEIAALHLHDVSNNEVAVCGIKNEYCIYQDAETKNCTYKKPCMHKQTDC